MAIFPKRLRIFRPNFTGLLCVPIYARIRIFIQLSTTLTKLCHISSTTQFTPCVQNVPHWPKCTLAFSDIFPKLLGYFSQNFIHLLSGAIYVRLQILIQLSPTVMKLCHIKSNMAYGGLKIFIQVSATLTKLCHIKRDHHHMLKMSTVG